MDPVKIAGFFCPTRIFSGSGSYMALRSILSENQTDRVFIMVDDAVRKGAYFQAIETLLQQESVALSCFSDIEPEPNVNTVLKAFQAQQSSGARLIIAVGGGSTIDAAKAVAILATNGGAIADYEGIQKFSTPPLPLIAIPSTAGTGSEVSGSCVISSSDGQRKMSIRHAVLNPARYAILDPLVLASVPAHVVAHAGIDAFVHAFESYISSQANPFSDALNLHAIELISGNLRQFYANRSNEQAALAMLSGSTLTGMVFGQTGLGNVHCMARFVGARFHLSHGLSNGLCLPYVARFNMLANPGKYARVARAMGNVDNSLTELQAARQAVVFIQELCDDLDIPSSLAAAGVDPASFEDMADACAAAGYEKWNPRQTTRNDFLNLFKRAYAGERLSATDYS